SVAQLDDDGIGRFRWKHKALPGPSLEAGKPRYGRDRRDTGKLRPRVERGNPQGLQGAGRDMRARGGIVDEHHVHVAAEQALNRGARAAIRNLVELDAGRLLKEHGGEMERVADSGMRDIDLARLPLG